MEIICWEVQEYIVYLINNTEYHFFTEEEALRFIETYKNVFYNMKKIEKAIIE